MIAAEKTPRGSGKDSETEIAGLRRELLRMLVPVVATVGWAWLFYVVIRGWELRWGTVIMLVLSLASYAAFKLSRRHYATSCCILLCGMIVAQSLLVGGPPFSLTLAFGSLVVIAANGLSSAHGALLVTILTWAANVLALRVTRSTMEVGDSGILVEALVLYLLTWGASWLMARPMKTSVEWALAGWTRAHSALEEVRGRRGEVYRALRALEEATYRIERMNNELVMAQQEAEEARVIKARFAATVSHELRGPLNLILGFSRLVALSPESYGEALPQAYRADIYTIYRNTQHMVTLVDDILDLSQVEAQRLPLVKDRIDLEADVVAKVIRTVQPLAERKGLYLHQELAGDLPWIVADPVRLGQALLNLLINAVRFTDKGGITVRTARQEDRLLASVQDTGPGIPVEHMPKLFDAFHQVQRVESRQSKGTGLGLSISKYLIELHRGKIWVESAEGVGTTFYFTIPLPGADSVHGDLAETEAWTPHIRACESCLVVHDDPAVVRLFARYLEDWRVVGLPDEQDVVALTEELHPRAIVTNPTLAERIEERLSHTLCDVPIISCTMPRLGEHLYSEGILSYLVKPIMPEALNAVMRKVEGDTETTVLLVEDDPDAMRLLERLLMSMPRPYNILKAYDGFEALELTKDVTPNVVLMDLLMPGIDGWETIARMRAEEHLRKVPVVIISAQDVIDDQVMLAAPIHVRYREPIDITRGVACFQALLNALPPRYLPRSRSVAK